VLSLGIVACVVLGCYVYFSFHEFHYNLSRAYASIGHAKAQHIVGERLLHGVGVQKDEVGMSTWTYILLTYIVGFHSSDMLQYDRP
jgi:hypothetical protein